MQLLLSLVDHYGLFLVFANVLALQLGLPLPAYPTLILVGALAAVFVVYPMPSLTKDVNSYTCPAMNVEPRSAVVTSHERHR